jgi:hypothetical protein
MVRDEAPAATTGGFNGKECGRVHVIRTGPTSFVAAEIHLGRRPAGICDGWPHCNIQVACHPDSYKMSSIINKLNFSIGTCRPAPPLISSRQPNN